MEMYEKLEYLEQLAEYEGTEWSETVNALAQLYHSRAQISKELAAALDQEIRDQFKWAEENLKLVEKTETYTRDICEVIYIGEE